MAKVWAALGIVYVVWGSTYLGIELAMRTIPPLLMLSIRLLVAGGLLYLWAGRRGPRPTARQWAAAAVIGTALLALGQGGVAISETRVDTGVVALIVTSMPLWLTLLDRLAYGNRLRARAVVGLVVGFAGAALLVTPGSVGREAVPYAVLVLFTSLAWAAGSLYARTAPQPAAPFLAPAMQMIAGGVVLGVAGLAGGEGGDFHPASVSGESLAALAYLVVVGSIVAFSAYQWLLRNAPTSLVGTYAFVNPVVAVLLGSLFLSEPLGLRTLVAGGAVVAAVALIVASPTAARAPRPVLRSRRDPVPAPEASAPLR